MNRKNFCLCFLLALFCLRAVSQDLIISSKGDSPKWITNPPTGYLNDYFVGEGESRVSLPEATKDALSNAITKYLQTRQFEARSSMNLTVKQNGDELRKVITEELVLQGSSITIKGLSQEESYYESWSTSGGVVYRYWVLIKIPKTTGFKEPPSQTGAIWRSVIGPGWGQFYKGQNTKGYIILISEVLLVPAGFILQSMKATAEVDAQNSRTQALRDYYVDEANTYHNFSIGCFIAAGAMYIFNLLDAMISEREKVYVESPFIQPTTHLARSDISFSLSIRF